MTRPPAPTEYDECVTFMAWAERVRFRGDPLSNRIVHIPNERDRHRSAKQAGIHIARMKKIGVAKGFPDYLVLAAFPTCAGLFLEAKRERGSKTSPEQYAWRDQLIAWGYEAVICKGAVELIRETDRYFRNHARANEYINRLAGW